MNNLAFIDIDIYENKEKFEDNEKTYTFEEAVNLVGNGRFHICLLLVCGMCFSAVMIELMGISLILDITKCDLNFGLYEQGFLASSGYLGIVSSSHAMGFFADTCGRIKTLKLALIFSLTASVISAFSVNIWMLISMRFLVGLFISACQACVFSFLGEFHGNETRTKSVTLLSTFLPIGLIILPAFAWIILPLDINIYMGSLKMTSWRFLILADTLPAFIALIGLSFFPESPKYLLIQGKQKEAINVLRQIFTINTGEPENNYPVKKINLETTGANFSNVKNAFDAIKLIWNQTVPLFSKKHLFNTLNISCLMFIIYGIAQGTFMWFPTILNSMVNEMNNSSTVCQTVSRMTQNQKNILDNNGVSFEHIDSCNAFINVFMYEVLIVMGVAYTCVYLVFSKIIDCVGKKPLIISWLIISGIATLLLYWITNFYLNVIFFTLCMAVGNAGGVLSTVMLEYFPTNISAMGICLMMMVARLGAIAGSNAIGYILTFNCEALFLVFGVSILGLTLLAFMLPNNDSKNKK